MVAQLTEADSREGCLSTSGFAPSAYDTQGAAPHSTDTVRSFTKRRRVEWPPFSRAEPFTEVSYLLTQVNVGFAGWLFTVSYLPILSNNSPTSLSATISGVLGPSPDGRSSIWGRSERSSFRGDRSFDG